MRLKNTFMKYQKVSTLNLILLLIYYNGVHTRKKLEVKHSDYTTKYFSTCNPPVDSGVFCFSTCLHGERLQLCILEMLESNQKNMSRKRMFSNDVINTDDFIDMPLSAQALYFHLGMNADDEGFIQPKRIMRMIQAKDDDIKVLLAKKFIQNFASGVIVIIDWNRNNYLDSNRIKETEYVAEKQELMLTEGTRYVFNKRLANVKQMLNQSRVEESRIEENRITLKVDDSFDNFWSIYPNKKDKKKARLKWNKLKQNDKDMIMIDVPNRIKNDDNWRRGFIPMPTTYINGERWHDQITRPKQTGKGGVWIN